MTEKFGSHDKLFIYRALSLNFSYPLLYMPLPGIVPAEFVAPVKGYAVPPERYSLRHRNEDMADGPRWVSD